MSKDESNRRLAARHRAQIRVLFRRHGVAHYLEAETDNLSLDGAFVRTRRKPLEVGTKLLVILSGDHMDTELSFLGTVTWIRDTSTSDEEQSPRGMGIRFDGLTDEQRTELKKTIDNLSGPPSKASESGEFDVN